MTDLIVSELNPAPFSPYFALTASWFFNPHRQTLGIPPVPERPTTRQCKPKPERFTVQEIFGRMRIMPDDDQAQFLLLLMKHVDVDWSVACKEAAKARNIPAVAQVRERLTRIAHKHKFRLEDGKKITGGLLLNKTLLAKPTTDLAGPKEHKAPKISRKRKSGGTEPKPPGTKKVRTTTETQITEGQRTDGQHTEGAGYTPIPGHLPVQQAENEHEAGSDGTLA